MKGHEDKIRIVLNKADMVDHQVVLVLGVGDFGFHQVLHSQLFIS